MKFKEIFKRYKSKTATESEIAYIEEEIEKSELIAQYLEENNEFDIEPDVLEEIETLEELKAVKKSMKKTNKHMIILSASLAVCVLLIINFVAVPILNNLFYSPIKRTISSNASDFQICMSTFHELHYPEPGIIGISTEYKGIGKYEVSIGGRNSIAGEYKHQLAKLNRGKLYFPLEYWDNFLGFNPESKVDFDMEKKYLAELPSYLHVRATISFRRDLTMEELVALYNKYNNLNNEESYMYFSWAGIRNREESNTNPMSMGFDMDKSGVLYMDVNEKYKNYEMSGYSSEPPTAEVYETHVKSLIQIMIDNKKYLDLHDFDPVMDGYYESALKYMNKNGVLSNGLVLIGTPNAILEFCNEDFVVRAQVDEVAFK